MNILFLSDFHGMGKLPEANPDLVVLLGDIDYYEIRKIDEAYDCPKIGVLGNHDGPDYLDETNIINIHRKIVTINGFTFTGFEGCPTYNRRPYLQYDEEQVSRFTEGLEKVDFFIAHSNPFTDESLDEEDAHRGFKAFTDYILEKQPSYFVHGHIHDAKEYDMENTRVISVYPTVELTIEKK